MKILRFLVAVLLLVSPLARADIVVDWNQQANGVMLAEGPGVAGNPIAMSRALAIMHIAMFDAIDACDPKYSHYLRALPQAPKASPRAAAHTAARAVLAALFPNQKSSVDKHYADAMAALPETDGKAAGVALGEKTAQLLLAQRKDDGTFGSPDSYRPFTAPGNYVPTFLPVVSNVALRKPFVLQSNAQFRPGPPPSLESGTWSRDFNETKDWGGVNSRLRSEPQTETARFWEQLGPPAWNQVARSLSTSRPMLLAENARVFALMNIAMFDAYLAVFEAKYHYNFWRPITAIRNGDQDGNDATGRDPTWRPLIDTPPHPEYPCAHCAADGAAGEILKSAFGRGGVPPFKLTFAAMSLVTREYDSIQQMQTEIFMARIWGGVHYRNSNEVGDALGARIGEYVLETTMTNGPAMASRQAGDRDRPSGKEDARFDLARQPRR
jgi:hypothetical protein